jgi:signal transduction histidine kinase
LDTISNPTPNKAETAAAKLTLLIVDDEEGPRQSLRIVFKNDYQVLLASSGPEAIRLAKTQPVHVAVLDIMMHGMSGVELLKHLKDINSSIEVVMLTAYETLETARQALRHGASDYINKPFDITAMRAAVAKAAQKHVTAIGLRQTTDELRHLQQEIRDQRIKEEMARTKGEIYASVLHDINSPLTVISGFIELINRAVEHSVTLEGAQLESIKGDLRNITGQVDRCFEISRRYLSFLKGGNTLQSTRTSVQQILADVKELLIRHPAAQGHQLVVRDPEPDVLAEINGTDLLQILLNLTINALQSTDQPHRVAVDANYLEDGLDLTKLGDSSVERFVNREGFLNRAPLVAISIRDTGPGIPPEVLRRMFQEQFTTKAAGQGTGLGLSIVRRLIREANGAIHLQTTVGHGSEFTILLQICE